MPMAGVQPFNAPVFGLKSLHLYGLMLFNVVCVLIGCKSANVGGVADGFTGNSAGNGLPCAVNAGPTPIAGVQPFNPVCGL